MKSKIIYLASPYGFSNQWKIKLLPEFISILESMGAIVWDPFNRQSDNDFANKGWAYKVASSNFDDLKRADAIFAILNGCPPDEGVMVELGISIALGKPTFLFRDDFRKCTDSDEFPLNLMTFLGIPYDSWEDYYYRSINEIENPTKAIFQWLNN
tara:strand:- start:1977 stop:2441 length:465 start_codon:yes stop_codon:yes gene_type:complete